MIDHSDDCKFDSETYSDYVETCISRGIFVVPCCEEQRRQKKEKENSSNGKWWF